ncbi:MAG: SCO family protein [Halodesulfurarchaeum sp.]
MSRRALLAGVGGVATGTIAGCTGSGNDGNTHLPPPDRPGDPEDLAYPAHGVMIPDEAIPAPLHDRRVSPREFDSTVLMTFFFSYCESVCPRLISTLGNIQATAESEGYGDEVNFLPVTFDPARDTADRLETYAKSMRIDLEAGNWYFLRPDGPDRADSVVTDEFGLKFERTDPNGDEPGYMFVHMPLILLVNPSGYVERAYTESQPVWQDVDEDVRTVIDRSTDQ